MIRNEALKFDGIIINGFPHVDSILVIGDGDGNERRCVKCKFLFQIRGGKSGKIGLEVYYAARIQHQFGFHHKFGISRKAMLVLVRSRQTAVISLGLHK